MTHALRESFYATLLVDQIIFSYPADPQARTRSNRSVPAHIFSGGSP